MDWLLAYWPMVVVSAVLAVMVLFILSRVHDAFRGQNGDDGEPPSLDVQNHRGDESQRGAH